MLAKALGGDASGVDLGVFERFRVGQREGRLAAARRDTGGALGDLEGASGHNLLLVAREQRQVDVVDIRAFAEGRGEVEAITANSGVWVTYPWHTDTNTA